MRETADKFDNRNPENEGMGKDLKGFHLVADTLQGLFVVVREDERSLTINHPEFENIEIFISNCLYSDVFTVEGIKEGLREISFTESCPMSSCKNITPEVVKGWFSTLLFKLEN